MIFLEQFKQHILSVFVRNISYHYCCSSIHLSFLNVNNIGPWLLSTDCSSIANCRGLAHIIIIVFWKHLDHHRHHGHWHGIGRIRAGERSVTSRYRVWAMLGILSNNPHAWVNNLSNNLIFFVTFWRISRPISFYLMLTLHFLHLLPFILEKE